MEQTRIINIERPTTEQKKFCDDLFMKDLTTKGTRKLNFSPRVRAFQDFQIPIPMSPTMTESLQSQEYESTQDEKDSQSLFQTAANNVASYVEELFEREHDDIDQSIENVSQSSQRNEEALERINTNLENITRIFQGRRSQH